MNIQVNIGIGKVLTYKYKRDNVQVIPDSCSVDIFSAGGVHKVVSAPVVIDANGTMTYSMSSIVAEAIGKSTSNRIVWTLEIAGENNVETNQLFDVVGYSVDDLGIDDEKFLNFAPYLRETMFNETGVAQVSDPPVGSNQLLDAGRGEMDGFYKGGVLEIFAGTGEGQERKVLSFSEGLFTLDRAWSVVPDVTSQYQVYRSYQDTIATAYSVIAEKLYAAGFNPSLTIDISQLSQLIMTEAAKSICFGSFKVQDDVWFVRFKELKEDVTKRIEQLKLAYDPDDTGEVEPAFQGQTQWKR